MENFIEPAEDDIPGPTKEIEGDDTGTDIDTDEFKPMPAYPDSDSDYNGDGNKGDHGYPAAPSMPKE